MFKIPSIQIRRQYKAFISPSNFDKLLLHKHIVIEILRRGTFVCAAMTKHKKEATIEFINCRRVDDSCFTEDGFRGIYCPEPAKRFILQDAEADSDILYHSTFYTDEIIEEREE